MENNRNGKISEPSDNTPKTSPETEVRNDISSHTTIRTLEGSTQGIPSISDQLHLGDSLAVSGLGSMSAATEAIGRMQDSLAVSGLGSMSAATEAIGRMQDSLAVSGLGSMSAATEAIGRMQDSLAVSGLGSMSAATEAIGRMQDSLAVSGLGSMSAATEAIGRMQDSLAVSGLGSMSAATEAIGRMQDSLAVSGLGSMSAATEAIGRMQDSLAVSGLGSMSAATEAIGRMQDSLGVPTGMSSLLTDQMQNLSDALKVVTGTTLLSGITDWQKSIQTSVSAIVGINSIGGISGLQKIMDSLPYRGVLDLNAKTWLDYARSVPDFSTLSYPRLNALTAVLDNYDSRIALQVEAFPSVSYLKAHQKHALIAHESRQRSVRLGPADIEYADTIALGIDATQALVDQIAGVDNDEEYFDDTPIEAEVFDILAKEGEEYPIPLRGAIQTASSDNPDKARQTMVSLRELTTHILHKLSPDSEVKKWSNKPEHYVNARPTRACRIEYIFRDCAGSSIKPYIENEVKFTKDFFDFLNGGTHSLDTRLDEEDLRYAIYKTESLVLLLLKYARR